jgi:S1-C subfamily serine protease
MNHNKVLASGLTRLALVLALAAIALIPLSSRADKSRREVVSSAMPASVFVLSADIINGKVVPVSSGSGTIITKDGSIITNFHVLNDKAKKRLHDVFIIGRFKRADQDPELVCAGTANSGKLVEKLDLALIKCTVDLEGRAYEPTDWPSIPIGDSTHLIPGEKITVIGYPGIGGSTIHVTSGELSGWSGEQGGAGRAFIKTDAHIAHGNSGGTALNEAGDYIGVPTAFRVHTEEIGGNIATSGKVGLIRPIEHAGNLIEIANHGWVPVAREADAAEPAADDGAAARPAPEARDMKPPAKPAADDGGVMVHGKLIDAANGSPIRGGFVVVFKPDITKANVDFEKVEQQALSYGQSNKNGEFELVTRVPRGKAYTVAAVAEGYQPLIEDHVLQVDDATPDRYAPWDEIVLERR